MMEKHIMSRFSNYSEIRNFHSQTTVQTTVRVEYRIQDKVEIGWPRIGYTPTHRHTLARPSSFSSQERKSDNPLMSNHVLLILILITDNSKLSWFFLQQTTHSSIISDKVANSCNLVFDRTNISDIQAILFQQNCSGSGHFPNWSVSSRSYCETISWNTFHSMWMCNR